MAIRPILLLGDLRLHEISLDGILAAARAIDGLSFSLISPL